MPRSAALIRKFHFTGFSPFPCKAGLDPLIRVAPRDFACLWHTWT